LKEIFQRRSRISSAIINNWSDNVRDYERSVFAIDVLRSAGVSNIFFVGKENANRELRRKLIGSRNNRTRSRDPGNIRTITMQKSGKPDSISTTELVYKKMIDQAVKAERRTDYSIALENYYAAFALIPDKADLAFKTELNIARIKTKIFRKKFPEFYDAILKKYANDPEKKKQIVYSLLRFCYTDPKENDCEKYYDQFISSQQSGETRSINSINFYRDLKNGDLKSVNSGYPAFLSQNSGEDVYLFHITLARMFLENHLLAKAETSALRALNESSSDEENLRAKQMLSAVRLQHLFLGGLGSISINSASADVIFSSGIAKDWQKFDAELKTNLIDDENVSGTERTNYRIKLYNSWKKIETGGDPTPLFLNPDDLPGGRSVLNYLGIVDRSLLFFVLQKSIPFQVDSELNNIFDRIYSREMNLKNIYRAQNLAIVWAGALLESGDYAASKKYISIIEKNFDRNIDSQNTTRFYFLKFRYSQMNKDLKLTDEELAYLRKNIPAKIALYDTAKKTDVRKLIEFLNANISKEKEAILEPYLKRELLDFVTYLQALSFKANNSEVFFDLAIAKDKIRSVTEKVFGEKITFSRIPEFRTISYELLKKLPDKQAFLAVLDYGHQTFFIKFSNGKSNGDLAFKDNRSVIDSVLEYHRLVKENGNAILQKETLEDRYRKAIRIDKNRLTYLYLSGIHLKAPLEHREEDNFYLVQSPEEMLKRDPYKISSDLDRNFALTQKLRTTYNPDWFRKLKKLENMELGGRTGGVQTSKAVVSQEELILKDRRKLEFAGIDLKDVSTLDKRQGNWFLSSSLLYESSFFSNDINTSLMYLDKIHSGPGVISIGSQRDLNNVYFLKNLFRKSDVRIALKDRFIDSIREVRKLFPDENHWNGYRLYTNVFLVE
ncbi:MAG: hypothetical protein K8R21_08650, partial [Leptospira sp.]|nr:hypothetical protein [Leptospira sp.]